MGVCIGDTRDGRTRGGPIGEVPSKEMSSQECNEPVSVQHDVRLILGDVHCSSSEVHPMRISCILTIADSTIFVDWKSSTAR